MKMGKMLLLAATAFFVGASIIAKAQTVAPQRALAQNVIVPQSRAWRTDGGTAARITEVDVAVSIRERVATTSMAISLNNPTDRLLEAELVVPVPEGAVVKGFEFQGEAEAPSAELLLRREARRLYNSIVGQVRDPALAEFAGANLIRTSVFPIEAAGTQKLLLVYEHILPVYEDRIDYILPRSEMLDYEVPWKISVDIEMRRYISTVYSPSHDVMVNMGYGNSAQVTLAPGADKEPGSFILSCLMEGTDGVTASLYPYNDPDSEDNYFLLLVGLPAGLEAEQPQEAVKREVIFVIDRSGSMGGGKIEQARAAILMVLDGLENGEAFNIVEFASTFSTYADAPFIKNQDTAARAREHINNIRAGGGTNIYDALLEALQQEPNEGMLPLILFLTDGQANASVTSETGIVSLANEHNPHQRRIFSFGVGTDVNAPLLENLAAAAGGTATFVLPGEDIRDKIDGIFQRLSNPVMTSVSLDISNANGDPAGHRVMDVMPGKLPDLYKGDQIVLIGRYRGDEPLNFRLTGDLLGERREFNFRFNVENASTTNAFVPRLWASRRIAHLIGEIRKLGADAQRSASRHGRTTASNLASSQVPRTSNPADTRVFTGVDPRSAMPVPETTQPEPTETEMRVRELVEEIVRLSKDFGILTEYTAFFAEEGIDLSNPHEVAERTEQMVVTRAMNDRTGLGGINQSANMIGQVNQTNLNRRNAYFDANMRRVEINNLQQVNDRAYYRQGDRWVESRALDNAEHDEVIEFGSDAWHELASRLAAQSRQGMIAMRGDIVMEVDGKTILVKNPSEN